jgi:cysteine desulfurase / selenocysteine lyase
VNRARPSPAANEAPAAIPQGARAFDVEAIRAQFPILARRVHGKPLVYLDNAATTQKPLAVLEALDTYYRAHNANVHRGVHTLSAEATALLEAARETVRRFLNAPAAREVVFVRGTTEAVNLMAQAWARPRLKPEDEILVTAMEHHSNLVPWQMVAKQTGATLRAVPIAADDRLDLAAFDRLLGPRTRLVSVGHVSNALGTVNPVAEIARRAKAAGALVVVDGAQGAPHLLADVQALGCDAYAFSGHKTYGPTGIGVLWAKADVLEEMEPWQGGGEMIRTVTLTGSTWNEIPYKFEAGTPDVAGIVGLGAALTWLLALDANAVRAHEEDLVTYAAERLSESPGIRLVGRSPERAGAVSFVMDGVHPHDIGTVLDQEGVAVRTGHHCAQPVMEHFGVPATARASFALYNTRGEVDALVRSLEHVRRLFGAALPPPFPPEGNPGGRA